MEIKTNEIIKNDEFSQKTLKLRILETLLGRGSVAQRGRFDADYDSKIEEMSRLCKFNLETFYYFSSHSYLLRHCCSSSEKKENEQHKRH